MNLYLPVWLYKVRYELAWGRPHSEIDTLVLDVLTKEPAALSTLCATFALPNPLMVEVLVTLARSGWIALDVASGAFRATAAGRRALDFRELPPYTHIEAPAPETLIVERLRGGIASRREVRFLHPRVLKDDSQFNEHTQVPGTFHARRLDAGQVDGLLRCDPPRWLRWVDTPALVSEVHWVCVHADVERGDLGGLPERWRRSLGEELLDFAAQAEGRGRSMRLSAESSLPTLPQSRWHPVDFLPDDLLTTPEDHAELLIHALRDAQSAVHVASAFCNPAVLGPATREALLGAARRGVRIGLLWGYEEGDKALTAVKWLKEVRAEAGEAGRNMLFNEEPSGSHAKFLFHDGAGQPTFYLGSYNWLSSPPTINKDSPINVTLRIRDHGLLSEILRTFAALWRNVPRLPWSPAAEHLQQIAAGLAERLVSAMPSVEIEPRSARARLIRDQEHEAILWEMLQRARERCLVASHKLGAKASIRLQPLAGPAAPEGRRAVIHYDQALLEESRLRDLVKTLAARGAHLARWPHLHAKCAVADHAALITSYNPLSADPFNNARDSREVGLLVEGGPIAGKLWEQFVISAAAESV
ncbi:MAG TPA: phospholipase D-like domain-containing protein [Chthoniobacter sp.]|nr:phospholipase D-like domain-containing protein [Chthoniobacter sp.]